MGLCHLSLRLSAWGLGLLGFMAPGSLAIAQTEPSIAPTQAILSAQRGLFRTITLSPRFEPDPLQLLGISGGRVTAAATTGRLNTETGSCAGYIGRQPDYRLVLNQDFDYLNLSVTSLGDTTLVIQGPGGTWCSDDQTAQNPSIGGQWLQGTYEIWVGSAEEDTYWVYGLTLSEVE
jgi:hypothetical protein